MLDPRSLHSTMTALRSTYRALVSLAAIVTASACSGASNPEDRLAVGDARVQLPGGLSQRVTLVPAVLVDGRDVEIRSVIVNNGAAAVALTTRICGLDYEGSLELSQPPEVLKCAAHGMTASLAPGDSVVGADIMRVGSTSGTYELKVRHVIDPSQWVSLQVVVRAP